MTEAIFGLVGVLVGGLVTWLTQWWQIRHVRKRQRRAAARLVLEEIASNYSAIATADELGGDDRGVVEHLRRSLTAGLLADSAWRESRGLLAEELADQEWLTLADAYFDVGLILGAPNDGALLARARDAEILDARDALWAHAFPSWHRGKAPPKARTSQGSEESGSEGSASVTDDSADKGESKGVG